MANETTVHTETPELQQAHESMDAAAKAAYERGVKQGRAQGYTEGFSAGSQQAVRAVHDAAMRAIQHPVIFAPEPMIARPEASSAPESVPMSLAPEDMTVSSRLVILGIIATHPGLRGVEIVRVAQEAGTPVNRHTVRTVLRRLQKNKRIYQRKKRWYVLRHGEATAALGHADDLETVYTLVEPDDVPEREAAE